MEKERKLEEGKEACKDKDGRRAERKTPPRKAQRQQAEGKHPGKSMQRGKHLQESPEQQGKENTHSGEKENTWKRKIKDKDKDPERKGQRTTYRAEAGWPGVSTPPLVSVPCTSRLLPQGEGGLSTTNPNQPVPALGGTSWTTSHEGRRPRIEGTGWPGLGLGYQTQLKVGQCLKLSTKRGLEKQTSLEPKCP